MSVSTTAWPASPLSAAETAFTALTSEPTPLRIDLDTFDPTIGLPVGVMPLPALRVWLLAHPRAHAARDAVWRELIRRARLNGPAWVIAAVGMAMPALRATVRQLRPGFTGEHEDLDAEILTGFLTALRDRVDVRRPAPHASLVWAAWRAGHKLRNRHSEFLTVEDIEHITGPRTPTVPYGHVDLLVRRAVRLGLLEAEDEQAWIDSRLGRRAIEPIAARLAIADDTLRMRLHRIDTRLAEALAQGLLTGAPSPQAAREIADKARHRAAIRTSRAAAARQADGTTPGAA